MIKKHGKKWVVTDSSGKKVLGTHDTKEKAVKQLAAVEISKKERKKENTMENSEHYYKIRCATLNTIKQQLISELNALNEALAGHASSNMQANQQAQVQPQGQQATMTKKPKVSPKKAIEAPVKTQHGLAHMGYSAEAQEDILKSYSDNPNTAEQEQAKDASWQSVNSAVGNYMSSQVAKMAQAQQMVKEESESNKRELARINADRKAEGKPPFRTLDAALSYYEKEDERARKKKLQG